MDPPDYGGGWMYLSEGKKDWMFLEPTPEALQSVIESGAQHLVDISPELAYQRAGVVFHEAKMQAGDLLYFPPGWLHRVRTYEKSIGVGGYLLLQECVADSEVIS